MRILRLVSEPPTSFATIQARARRSSGCAYHRPRNRISAAAELAAPTAALPDILVIAT
jgi:hypothetical protein